MESEPLQCVNAHKYYTPMWGECPICQGIANRRKQERCADAMQRVKAAIANGNDKEAYFETKTLRELGHPDVDGLCAALRRAFDEEKSKSKPKGGRKDL
jgi:hypothetical protein